MTHLQLSSVLRGRAMALVACTTLAVPMAAAIPPVSRVPTEIVPLATAQLTARKKLVMLVGAAALYYLYRKHQRNAGRVAGPTQGEPVYYLSKNGRVYYRDASAQAHWVTPPPQGIRVPFDEAQSYRGLQGYDRSPTGETNLARFYARSPG